MVQLPETNLWLINVTWTRAVTEHDSQMKETKLCIGAVPDAEARCTCTRINVSAYAVAKHHLMNNAHFRMSDNIHTHVALTLHQHCTNITFCN